MDETLVKALKKRDKLRKQLEQVEQFIDLFQALFGEDGEGAGPAFSALDTPSAPVKAAEPRRKRGNPSEIADAVEKVIRDMGQPLQRGDIVDMLEIEGHKIRSADKPRYIGTILWRNNDRFVNIEGRGYWLKDVPLPGAGNLFEPVEPES